MDLSSNFCHSLLWSLEGPRMFIVRHFIVLICILSVSAASVVFQNDDQATPFRSTKLTQIAGTMAEMVRIAMESVGSVNRSNQSDLVFPEVPFSNQEDRIILNVFLYDERWCKLYCNGTIGLF